MTYRILDLFCGAGGAAAGYSRAGFEVVGVDIDPQKNYPFFFFQADALNFLASVIRGLEFPNPVAIHAIHASPPCQAHTDLKHAWNARQHADLIPATRELLKATGLPYVIENVPGAGLLSPVTLCGCMFSLGTEDYRLVRKREFETPFPLPQLPCRCDEDGRPVVGVYGGKVRNRRAVTSGSQRSRVGTTLPLEVGQKAMGIDWMTRTELSQAIPPTYTEYVGTHLRQYLETTNNREEAA